MALLNRSYVNIFFEIMTYSCKVVATDVYMPNCQVCPWRHIMSEAVCRFDKNVFKSHIKLQSALSSIVTFFRYTVCHFCFFHGE